MNKKECVDYVGRREVIKSAGAPLITSGLSGDTTIISNITDFYTKRTVWSTNLDINGLSSAATVVDDTVYIAGGDLYALDARTGSRKWTFEEDSGTGASAPEIHDGTAYYGSLDSTVYAVNVDSGTLEWSYETEGRLDYSSPTVANGTVYIGSGHGDGSLYAIDATTGELEWREPLRESLSAPTVLDGTLYISNSRIVSAIDAATGEQEWGYRLGSSTNSSAPAIGDDAVYMSSNDYVIHAIDRQTGQENWKAIETPYSGTIFASPTVSGNRVYAASALGTIVAVDTATGEVQWELETPASDFLSSPTIANDIVYVGSPTGELYAVDAPTGELRWSYNIDGLSSVATTTEINSSPTVVSGIIYLGAEDGSLYAIATDHKESSSGSRVQYGTLGHHHTWADSAEPSFSPSRSISSQKILATVVGGGVPALAVHYRLSNSSKFGSMINRFRGIRGPTDEKTAPVKRGKSMNSADSTTGVESTDTATDPDTHSEDGVDTTTSTTDSGTEDDTATANELQEQAIEAIDRAEKATEDSDYEMAVESYEKALTQLEKAAAEAEDSDVKNQLESTLAETEAALNSVTTRREHRDSIGTTLQAAERSFKEGIARYAAAEQTVARIRFRQARDAFEEAQQTITESDTEVLAQPIEVSFEQEATLPSLAVEDLAVLEESTVETLAAVDIESITDLESDPDEKEITPPVVSDFKESDEVSSEEAALLTILSWWYNGDSREFGSETVVSRRYEQADYGFNQST